MGLKGNTLHCVVLKQTDLGKISQKRVTLTVSNNGVQIDQQKLCSLIWISIKRTILLLHTSLLLENFSILDIFTIVTIIGKKVNFGI
ncbi:hypothetical protein T10_13466 [Trichinella papuae]|uniref:Uncharacterized protein n=1 Tax=Trichinella papuae TaxID=268474 RepID=A0A0V1M9Y0_9BILA|nr:hypothetical protein T10_13466 [Trichinella papuae]